MRLKLVVVFLLTHAVLVRAESPVRFSRDIRPILSDRCFQCHGPSLQEAELRLDQADGELGAYRTIDEMPAVKPGSPDESALWHRINAGEDEIMPPAEASKPPLDEDEKELVRRWIEQGAEYEAFWAFVPPSMPSLPQVDDPTWSRHPLDRLVFDQLQDRSLTPSPRADRRTLIRRLCLDLTGLPPSRDEINEFLNDTSPDAYEQLVDRLLDKPQFGEHMTKFWLDLVRFADTNGIHHDHYREMSPYRDWVIRAYNDNLPYDDFLRYQLAGDSIREG